MFSKMRTIAAAAIISASATAVSTPATAGTDAFIGEIMLAGFNFCPRNTMAADGRLLPISQYTALFSLFGTYYGGDGRSTFALPDLRGRAPISQGTGPGLSPIQIGQKGGAAGGLDLTRGAAAGSPPLRRCIWRLSVLVAFGLTVFGAGECEAQLNDLGGLSLSA